MILYKSLVRPVLDYCVQVWRPYTQKDITLMERVKKIFTKMIVGCKDQNYSRTLNKLHITTSEEIYQRSHMIQVLKILNDVNDVGYIWLTFNFEW
jgi:ribonuclease P/MRP protein subunit RPP40